LIAAVGLVAGLILARTTLPVAASAPPIGD
jgi:hypothetical protein